MTEEVLLCEGYKAKLALEKKIARYLTRKAKQEAAAEREEEALRRQIAGMGDTYIMPVLHGPDKVFKIPPGARKASMAWRGKRRRRR